MSNHGLQSEYALRLETVLHAAAASANSSVAGGQNGLGLGILSYLGQSVDETTDETDEDGGDTAKGDGGIEENQTTDGNGELVQGADHRVGSRRGDTDSPGGSIGDEDG
jgi:hypothetical protein